ncbi:PrsW family intramembrane metalloprotease [Salininema proteolyticum]|uniref:PrsW family intramembrane metalloprotease n=1 Tax=Salininema proteolyticum TaxID=1607685 RepID=A0ABV8TTD4_9ACTN
MTPEPTSPAPTAENPPSDEPAPPSATAPLRPDPGSPAQWTFLTLVVASTILLLYSLLPAALAYPLAGSTAIGLFALFAVPLWIFRRRIADRVGVGPAALTAALLWGGTVAVMTSLYGSGAVRGLLAASVDSAWAEKWAPVMGAPVVEETVKAAGVVLVAATAWQQLRSPLDGLLIGAFCGAGFQIVEGYAYAMSTVVLHRAGDEVQPVVSVFIVRGLLAGLWSHAVFTAIAGAGIVYAMLERTARSRVTALAACAFAVACHTLWNSPLLRDGLGLGTWGILGGVLLKGLPAVIVAVWLTKRLLRTGPRTAAAAALPESGRPLREAKPPAAGRPRTGPPTAPESAQFST